MNKSELIETITVQMNADKKVIARTVDTFLDTVVRSVQKGERVVLTGFGSYEKKDRPARTGRNPKTGATVKLRKTSVPRFKAGANFKDVVSGAKKLPKPPSAAAKAAATKTAASAAAAKTPAATRASAARKTPAAAKSTATKTPATNTTAAKATATRSPATKTTAAPAKRAASKSATAGAAKTTSGAKTAAAAKSTSTAVKSTPRTTARKAPAKKA